jgi:hypothetical protein
MSNNLILDLVQPFEEKLNIKPGFFENLQNEDDWSFIIKSHAFLEAALSYALTKTTGKDELGEIYTKLDLNNSRTGKVAFATALHILDEQDRRFISQLSKLRNLIVHNITQVDFNLSEYISQLDKNTLNELVSSFGYIPAKNDADTKIDRAEITRSIKASPKETIWYGLMIFTAKLYMGKSFPIVFILLILLQEGVKGLPDALEKAKDGGITSPPQTNPPPPSVPHSPN